MSRIIILRFACTFIVLITKFLMIFSILELVTCFKAGGPRLGLTMSQGAARRKSLGTTGLECSWYQMKQKD